jgi:hypothetical protein
MESHVKERYLLGTEMQGYPCYLFLWLIVSTVYDDSTLKMYYVENLRLYFAYALNNEV